MSATAILRTCFNLMHYSGAARLARPVLGGEGVIFCLHRVLPDTPDAASFSPNAKLQVTPEFLSEIISLMTESGFDLLSLGEAVEHLKRGQPREQPFAVFTLDDGYTDNLVHAQPVFERLNCPFTVFAAPRITEGTCELWWMALEQMIAGSSHITVELDGSKTAISTATLAEKHQAWKQLLPHVQLMPEYAQRQWIQRAADSHRLDLPAMCRSVAMTWDQLRRMNQSPLCTIGAHTLNHYSLAQLPEADARREIVESGRIISEKLGEKVMHFAYPYGLPRDAGPREFRLAAEAGYESAVVTRLGPVYREHAPHLHALPRIMVSGRFQTAQAIAALVSGLPSILKNRFQRINVA